MTAPPTTAHDPDARPGRKSQPSVGARRFGYVVAIGVNIVALYVVHHLIDWGWPRFLTDEFDQVLPLITVSIVVSLVANALFVVRDPPWFKSLANAIGAAIAFAVAIRTYQVFPFDFSDYARDWSGLLRVALVVGMVATAVAGIVEAVRTVRWLAR